MNPGYPITLDVKGFPCVVLGGDQEAADKAQRLLDAGAKVTVISPTLNDALKKLTASAKVIHRGRTFRATDLLGVIVVLNCYRDDRELSATLMDAARKERFQLWSVDQPEFSTFAMPAVVSRGGLRVAISTGGASPALASRIRQDLEQVFGPEAADFVEWLAALREEAQSSEPDGVKRRELLKRAVEQFVVKGQATYPEEWVKQRS